MEERVANRVQTDDTIELFKIFPFEICPWNGHVQLLDGGKLSFLPHGGSRVLFVNKNIPQPTAYTCPASSLLV